MLTLFNVQVTSIQPRAEAALDDTRQATDLAMNTFTRLIESLVLIEDSLDVNVD